MLPKNDKLYMFSSTNSILTDYPSLDWKFDKLSGKLNGMTDYAEAMVQAVEILLNTERFRHVIYTPNYGVELNGLIGKDYIYVDSDLPRRISEALSVDDRILNIDNFETTLDNAKNSILVTFTVNTIFGEFDYQKEVSI